MILLVISFIAGILTALAPCVLPLLPVIVGGSIAQGEVSGRNRAYTIAISLGVSVVVFTLLLKVSTIFINVPPVFWQWFSGSILVAFGLVMVFPTLWDSLPIVNALNRSSNRLLSSGYQKNSFWGDVIMGAALGPVFSSCSPTYFVILATVLPASFFVGFANLIVYAIGLSGFLLLIALAGQRLVDRLGVAIEPGGWFRRTIGVLFVIVGVAVLTGTMARVEVYLLDRGFDLTFIEQRLLSANLPTQNQCTDGTCNGGQGNMNINSIPPIASSTSAQIMSIIMQKKNIYRVAPELVAPDGYINTGGTPITISEFRGKKVVLIDIWTYSCINCQRTLPYLKAWYDKYKDQGLEIIGVHTPEFAFEKVMNNVQNAARGFGLTYPIILDNEYKTWNAFGNQYWPRKYLVDIDGFIVYDHAGEGSYAEAEVAIQKALMERRERLGLSQEIDMAMAQPEDATVDLSGIGSPEVYFGAARNEYLGSGTPGQIGEQYFEEPISVAKNTLYLIGKWNLHPEYAETSADVGSGAVGSDRINYRYRAKNVFFVAGSSGESINVEILRDSKPIEKSYAGSDIFFKNGRSYISVKEERLYNLIKDTESGDHFLEMIISKPGLQAYTFTFG